MKTMAIVGSAALAAVLALSGAAQVEAQSLKVKERMAAQEAELQRQVAALNKKCGTNFTARFDWSAAPQTDLFKYSAAGYCDNGALAGIQEVCGHDLGKPAAKDKIKTVICGFGSERTIALKDGVLDYKINFDSSNDFDFVYEYLQNNL
jgi:hypothetical protein